MEFIDLRAIAILAINLHPEQWEGGIGKANAKPFHDDVTNSGWAVVVWL